MASMPDFPISSQLPPNQAAAIEWCTEESPPADRVWCAHPQLSHAGLWPESQTETLFSQFPYDPPQETTQNHGFPLQNIPHLRNDPYQTSIASFGRSIHAAERHEGSWAGSPTVHLTQLPPVLPPVLQPPLPLPLMSVQYWVEVPQRVYDRGQRQWNFKQTETIYFNVDGFPGINLWDAFQKHFMGLHGSDDPMFQNQDTAGAITCRFLFPGYPNQSAQISTLGWAKDRTPITRSKLAYDVARKLNQYLESMTGRPMSGPTNGRWKIGEGFMHLENMFLVSLVSVSKGSFQPVIWVMI